MIAKQIKMRQQLRSSVTRLVDYCLDEQQKVSRVAESWCVNCGSDDPKTAARMMEATQLLNKRAKGDKTYHLVVSFAMGETVDKEVMKNIERELCEALGYGEHQRIAVVHADTDALHFHIAINRVSPVTLKKLDPHNDYDILAKTCEKIEKQYGLVHARHKGDDRETEKTQSENHLSDMARMNGNQSLCEWIQENCLEKLKAAKDWKEFQAFCAENHIEYKLRGNGAVFVSGETIVKASTVDRELSKAQLEKRFGEPFPEIAEEKNEETAKLVVKKNTAGGGYKPKPRRSNPESDKLFAEYKAALDDFDARRGTLMEAKNLRYIAIREQYYAEILKIRSGWLFGSERKKAIEAAKQRKNEALKKLRNEYKPLYAKLRRRTWVVWLKEQAESGREDALRVLRRRAWGIGMKNSLGGESPVEDIDAIIDGKNIRVDGVTKQGTILYDVGGEIVRANDKGFYCYGQTNEETLIMMLKMTAKKFGNVIEITDGDAVFRKRCVEAAAKAKLGITFKDAEMEQARKDAIRARRLYLEVPFAEKEQAKAVGAVWDKELQKWYVSIDRKNAQAIQRWLPEKVREIRKNRGISL